MVFSVFKLFREGEMISNQAGT